MQVYTDRVRINRSVSVSLFLCGDRATSVQPGSMARDANHARAPGAAPPPPLDTPSHPPRRRHYVSLITPFPNFSVGYRRGGPFEAAIRDFTVWNVDDAHAADVPSPDDDQSRDR